MNFPFKEFIDEAIKQQKDIKYIQDCVIYAQKLNSNNLPVIFSIEHLAILIGIQSDYLRIFLGEKRNILTNNPYDNMKYYHRYEVKKKKGGTREICTPNKHIKYIQKWILKNILEKVAVHENCKGFIKNISIKDNALIHSKADQVLKLDLYKFYDTITDRRVYGFFKSLGYHPNLCVALAKICTIKHSEGFSKELYQQLGEKANYAVLPQGAPTSPMLSNLIAKKLDYRLTGLANKYNLNYSRYADDLTFSSNTKSKFPAIDFIKRIIEEEGFKLNDDKTAFMNKGNKQYVTGLTIQNGVHTPKKYRQEIKQHIYFCLKYGVKNHLIKLNLKNKYHFYNNSMKYCDWLYGHICFISSIDKEYGDKLLNDYNKIYWPV